MLSGLLSNEKFRLMGDSFSELEKLTLLLPIPTWAAITSEAPRVLILCPVQELRTRVNSSTTKMPMGRLRSRTKKTGTLSVTGVLYVKKINTMSQEQKPMSHP